ncbi:MAG: hypothetical protein Tsb009_08870 [Planctomycetaceae bacterium]
MANSLFTSELFAQNSAKPSGMTPANRWPRMVHEWFVKQVHKVERKANARRDALKTKTDAEKYVADVRRRILQSFGPFPEKTPLKPRVTKTIKRDGYNIENIIFESRPGFLVTANLYVPTNRKGKLPGVVGTCGHSSNGKAAGAYQGFAQGLARQGYVVLIYDPIGQGERLQYADEKLHSKVGVGVREHLYAGNQQFLVGEFFGSWRAWDGIRSLDYLLTRKEVDPKRIGVTGNSGGGTMTTWLCGVEQRWTMAAPSCFVTTFRRNMENELPADTEQCPPRALALGLDHSDFIAAMAPKPVILLAKEKDYFDARGTQEAYARLKKLYKLLGHEKNIGLFIGPTYHGYSQENREAMYGWFNKATGLSDNRKEPDLTLEKDETLYCTPKGQVAELKSKTVFDFTRAKAERLKRANESMEFVLGIEHRVFHALKIPFSQIPHSRVVVTKDRKIYFKGKMVADCRDGITKNQELKLKRELKSIPMSATHSLVIRADGDVASGFIDEVFRLVSKLGFKNIAIGVRDGKNKPIPIGDNSDFKTNYRIIRHRGGARKYPTPYHITYAVETEPGIQAVVYRLSKERLYSRPPLAGKRAILYVAHKSSDDELRTEPLIKSMISAEPNVPFYTVDVRGIGESRPGTAGAEPFKNPYGADYFYAIHSLMLDRPYVGQRTFDLLRVLDWLHSVGHSDVHLVGKGWGALPATFAAVLSKRVKQVTLKNALTSFHDLATHEFYDWPLSSFVPNVLGSFDLPDCYAALKSKKLKQIDPQGAK